ncbi:MAG: hypothetical protein U1F26_01905 [Lysobacterales bacterium]
MTLIHIDAATRRSLSLHARLQGGFTPPQEETPTTAGGRTVKMWGEVVNRVRLCRKGSEMLRCSIVLTLLNAEQAEWRQTLAFTICSGFVSGETNCCAAQQVVD